MYQLPILPYDYYSLEPFIDTHALALHYQKHAKNYLKKLNELLLENDYDFKYPMELLSFNMDKLKESTKDDILFNLGGVLNHIIYFYSMNECKMIPEGNLRNKILHSFGSLDNFFNIIDFSFANKVYNTLYC